MFSSASDMWETPTYLFNYLNNKYNFTLDVCATSENAKCENYYTESDNALNKEWSGTCWMNPPYGRQIGRWLQKAYESAINTTTVVCLIPARTDTKYFHEVCMKADEICFIKGRLKFGTSTNSAPFPSAIVIFKEHNKDIPTFSTLEI